MSGVRILVVEDEPKMTALLARALTEEGHTVDTVADGRHAVAAVDGGDYDAVVLDVMLPGIDGFEVCARLRRQRVWTPVLMLTARGAVTDRIAGLDGGADDYLTKPFNLDELFARLRALSRRGPIPRPPTLEAGDLRLDPSEHRVWRADTEIRLSHKEFTLLEALIRRPGIVHTRAQLLERCWDAAYEARSNIVDVYIRYLRDKIEPALRRHLAGNHSRCRIPAAQGRRTACAPPLSGPSDGDSPSSSAPPWRSFWQQPVPSPSSSSATPLTKPTPMARCAGSPTTSPPIWSGNW
ncbi:transcriptional regulator [Mycobacterium tuberculosis RGTB423]|nr:transcriptional regulator [Mycobacterium tuberculosis RGTB423]